MEGGSADTLDGHEVLPPALAALPIVQRRQSVFYDLLTVFKRSTVQGISSLSHQCEVCVGPRYPLRRPLPTPLASPLEEAPEPPSTAAANDTVSLPNSRSGTALAK